MYSSPPPPTLGWFLNKRFWGIMFSPKWKDSGTSEKITLEIRLFAKIIYYFDENIYRFGYNRTYEVCDRTKTDTMCTIRIEKVRTEFMISRLLLLETGTYFKKKKKSINYEQLNHLLIASCLVVANLFLRSSLLNASLFVSTYRLQSACIIISSTHAFPVLELEK